MLGHSRTERVGGAGAADICSSTVQEKKSLSSFLCFSFFRNFSADGRLFFCRVGGNEEGAELKCHLLSQKNSDETLFNAFKDLGDDSLRV